MAITTALGSDALLLENFTYSEDIGRPFELVANVTCEKPKSLKIQDTIGRPATVRLRRKDKKDRFFNGVVSRISENARVKERPSFEVTIVPKLWLLTKNSDCRIFQRKSVPQIIKSIFTDRGIQDSLVDKLNGSFPKHDYLVQYRETDFNFVSRLMELEGIYYFFDHSDGRHQMVLANDTSCHQNLDGYAKLPFLPDQFSAIGDRIVDWRHEAQIESESVTLRAFDFKAPNTKPKGTKKVDLDNATKFELFDYPVEFHVPNDAKRYSRVRAEELAASAESFTAKTDCRGIVVGGKFQLSDPSKQLRADQLNTYMISSVSCRGSVSSYQSGQSSADEEFSCGFRGVRSTRVFRPARLTPKPVVSGAQTATVVGPSGTHIHTDKYGRIKVQFHWDRYGTSDQNSSCWIRVSQVWAGRGWGGLIIPRVGHEVVVDFLEGDPDRPIVTGRLYNELAKPPVNLPANASISGLRSDTVGTDGGGYNEVMMDDTAGKELLNLQAQFDMKTLVKHDQTDHVQNNRKTNVDVDDAETIGANQTNIVGKNRTETVGKSESLTVAMMRTHTVGINEAITIGVAQQITVGAAQTITVGAAQALTVGAFRQSTVALSDSLTVGKTLTINAGDEITIKTGDASIVMKKDGTITIKGKNILISGSGKISVKADGDVTIKGSKIAQN